MPGNSSPPKRSRVEKQIESTDLIDHDVGAAQDRVITLNVGGKIITTLESTLRSHPSRLSTWVDSKFGDLPHDSEGRPFIDRDAANFTNVLNYLRGYGLPTRSEELVFLAADAEYFDLACLKKEVGLDGPSLWRFSAGPGVREDGMQFSTADILGLCGSEPLSPRHAHDIHFRIDKCELVSVGVISLADTKEDKQMYQQRNSVSYCNTGELVRYWPDEPLFTSGAPFKAQDVIHVRVQFLPPGCTNSSLPPPVQPSPRVSTLDRSSPIVGPQPAGGLVVTEVAGGGAPADDEEEEVPLVNLSSSVVTVAADPSALSPTSQFDEEIGAIITFSKDNRVEFEVRWPTPVPPIQFAVSMQGASSVSIADASKEDQDEGSLARDDRAVVPQQVTMEQIRMRLRDHMSSASL